MAPKNSRIKPRGVPYKTKPELAVELIRLTRSCDPDITLRVVVDGGFSHSPLVKDWPANVHITGKVRMDAVLYEPVAPDSGFPRRGRPRRKGTELSKPCQTFNYTLTDWEGILIPLYGKETMLLVRQLQAIRHRVGSNEILSIVLVRDPDGDYPDTVLFDADVKASDEETINRFSHRWSFEITNRATKHFLGSADPQCRCENSVARVPLMPIWSYCLVVIWFADQIRRGKDFLFQRAPWYPKKNISSSDMLAAVRRSRLKWIKSANHILAKAVRN